MGEDRTKGRPAEGNSRSQSIIGKYGQVGLRSEPRFGAHSAFPDSF
jgi:hypothetical protein